METIESIGDLIGILVARVGTDNRVLWFRGHRSARWDLLPTAFRGYDPGDERNLTNRFRSCAGTRYPGCPEYKDYARWLSLMQHYGLPTRLLDWTRSPLVALYFAVEPYIHGRPDKLEDAAIWVFEPHRMNLKEVGEDVTPDIAGDMCRAFLAPAFHDKGQESGKVIAAMASEIDMRMFVQQGCFTIHSCREALSLRQGHDGHLAKITIPAESLFQLALEVDICGFRRGDVFPDLANLAEEFKGRFPAQR